MVLKDLEGIKFFSLKNDDEDDPELRILKIKSVDYNQNIVHAFRYYAYENDEVDLPTISFLNDEIVVIDPKVIEEKDARIAEELRKAEEEYKKKLEAQNRIKSAHFLEYNSPYLRGQEIELIKGYPRQALDFSTKEDRYYLDDCKVEAGVLFYSLMTVGTRKHRENCIYTFFTKFVFQECHFKIIEGSFYKPVNSQYMSGIDWKEI